MNVDENTTTDAVVTEETLGELTERADRTLGVLMFITGALAWAGSAILVWERMQIFVDANHQTICDLNALINCGTVMRTPYAEAFGFPNPFIGIVGFAIIMTIGAGLMAGARYKRWYWVCVQLGVTFAMGFVLWLWYNTTFNINALCLFCMLVWLMTIPLFVKVTTRNITAAVIPAPTGVRRAAEGWAWFTVVLVYLLVYGIIVIRFFDQIVNLF